MSTQRTVPAYDWRVAIQNIAGRRTFQDTRQSWLERAARKANISYRQAKALFYGEAPDPRSSLADKIRRAEKAALRDELALNLEQNAERLDAVDADFYEPTTEAMRAVAKRLRGDTR